MIRIFTERELKKNAPSLAKLTSDHIDKFHRELRGFTDHEFFFKGGRFRRVDGSKKTYIFEEFAKLLQELLHPKRQKFRKQSVADQLRQCRRAFDFEEIAGRLRQTLRESEARLLEAASYVNHTTQSKSFSSSKRSKRATKKVKTESN